MSAREILQSAIMQGILPRHLYGKTPHKTLQARLSEDILANQQNSLFYRTSAGEFFLRELAASTSGSGDYKSEYIAPRRKSQIIGDRVLAIKKKRWIVRQGDCRFVSADDFHIEKNLADFDYISRDSASRQHYLPVVSFILMRRKESVLSFVVGKWKRNTDILQPTRSIGFGTFVREEDKDFTYDSYYGVIESGLSALCHGTGLPNDLAEAARYSSELTPRFWTASRTQTGEDALFLLADYICPRDFEPGRPNLSFTGLKWIDIRTPPNDLTNYDDLSSEILQNNLPNTYQFLPTS